MMQHDAKALVYASNVIRTRWQPLGSKSAGVPLRFAPQTLLISGVFCETYFGV